MVAVLLSHIHAGLVRIDGKGGDVARLRFGHSRWGEAYELKSFTGRMTLTRRRESEEVTRPRG